MIKRFIVPLLVPGVLAAAPAFAESKEMVVEIYRVAPGKHEEFLRQIALLDQANAEAGLPPRQLFVHQGGASFDFVLLQPAHNTDEENAKLGAAFKGSASRMARNSSSLSAADRRTHGHTWKRPRRRNT